MKAPAESVTFNIEGDPIDYRLVFNFNHIVDAEELSGCNLMRPLVGTAPTAREARALLFAYLKTDHPQLLLKEAGELISRSPSLVLGALVEALRWNPEEAPEEPAAAPSPSEAAPTEA